MIADDSHLEVRPARDGAEIAAAQRLRYEVFVAELGGDGPGVDHAARRESDGFDAHAAHLLLIDHARSGAIAGAYRLMDEAAAAAAGGFYCAEEYDLAPLLRSGRRLLELGRSCLAPDYRGGLALHRLWQGLAAHVRATGAEILFGVASFHGTDTAALAQPLSYLARHFRAPAGLCPEARPPGAARMDLLEEAALDRRAAMLATPALIKAYLRAGGRVGRGAYVDRAFNTTDVCMVLDTAALSEGARARFGAPA